MYVVSVGPSGISPHNVPKKAGSSAWGIPRASDVFHDSSDVSLFSSSLPVLPHEKCKLKMMFLIEQIGIIHNVSFDILFFPPFIVDMQ